MKQKLTEPGQHCRHCGTPVLRVEHKPNWRPRLGRVWYRWWLKCPKCSAIYIQQSQAVYPAKPERARVFEPDDAAWL